MPTAALIRGKWIITNMPAVEDEARFTKCGICTLMKELGLYDLTPSLCHLDYNISEGGETSNFIRKYTLASGGQYCDCGYKEK